MLSITPNFTIQDIEKDMQAHITEVKQDIVRSMVATLHDLVDTARRQTKSGGGFNNITWNLRSSIGGCVLADHQIVETYFPPLEQGDEGRQKGIGLAIDVARMQDDGQIILVFVAGEEYASFLEDRGDIDVISGTSKYLDKFLKSYLTS